MNTGTLAADVGAVQGVAQTILETIAKVDPAVGAEAAVAEEITLLVGGLVTAALNALQNASGEPINMETVTALLPNIDPLPEPA